MNWSDSIWGQNLAFKTCDESCIAAYLVFKLTYVLKLCWINYWIKNCAQPREK